MNAFPMMERCWLHQCPLYSTDVADVSGPYERAIANNRDRVQGFGEVVPLDSDWAPPVGAWDPSWS